MENGKSQLIFVALSGIAVGVAATYLYSFTTSSAFKTPVVETSTPSAKKSKKKKKKRSSATPSESAEAVTADVEDSALRSESVDSQGTAVQSSPSSPDLHGTETPEQIPSAAASPAVQPVEQPAEQPADEPEKKVEKTLQELHA